MVLVLAVAVVALAVAMATGPRRLAQVRVRAVRLLVVAAGLQVVVSVLAASSGVARAVTAVLTTLLVGLFLTGNARLPGVPLILLGLLLNVVVVAANAGMPVSVAAAARAGIAAPDLRLGQDAMRERLDARTRFGLLGDVVPVALPGRSQVVSPGDVLVAAGVGLLIVTAGPRRRQAPRRPAHRQTVSRAVRSTAWESDSTTTGSYS